MAKLKFHTKPPVATRLTSPHRCGPLARTWLSCLRPSAARVWTDATTAFYDRPLAVDESMNPTRPNIANLTGPGVVGLFATAILSLVGCDQSTTPQNEGQSPAQSAEQQLPADPAAAALEVAGRLRKSVWLNNGWVEVKDPDLPTMYLVSPNTSWTIDCGVLGISVTFGESVSGDSNSAGNDVQVTLSSATLSTKDCETLAPVVASEIKAIFDGGTGAPPKG
jgi:hypothetical protein